MTPSGNLTVLGCDGSYPGAGGAASGYLVRTGTTTIWLDAGPGTFAKLQEVCFPGDIDAIVLSHEHHDHWTDLESFAVWARLQPTAATFLVVAPPGLQERSYAGRDRSLKWQEAEPSLQVDVGDLRCRFSATDHGPPTFAVRFDRIGQGPGGPPLVYSADTGPGWSVDELGEDIGTFLCEATYLKDQEGTFGHLSGRQAGSMARDASVAQLVVTHRRPTVEAEALGFEAAEAFGREVHQAVPGVVFEW